MKPEVENWYADLEAPQRQIALALRDLVLNEGEDLREDLKWNQPCYSVNAMVCYIQKAKEHVALGFGKGAKLADPDGVLEGSGAQMRHVKVPLSGHINTSSLQKLIRDAIRMDTYK